MLRPPEQAVLAKDSPKDSTFYPCLRTNDEAWLKHTGRATLKRVSKGDTVIRAGDPVRGLIYLREGLLKYTILTEEGDVRTVGMMEPTTLVGEGPLFLGLPSLITVEAMADVAFYFFPKALVHDLIREDPDIAVAIITNLAGKVRMLLHQVSDLQFCDLRTRLSSLLFFLASTSGVAGEGGIAVTLGLSHEELASLVGANRSTVTTVLGQMRDEGLIEFGTRRIEILDMPHLCEHASEVRLAGEPERCDKCQYAGCGTRPDRQQERA